MFFLFIGKQFITLTQDAKAHPDGLDNVDRPVNQEHLEGKFN